MRRGWRQDLVELGRRAALGTLCAGAAHEMNNPLAYVITNLRYLAEQLPGMLRDGPCDASAIEDVTQTLADALEGASRVGDIVAELREYAHASDAADGVDVRAALDRAAMLTKAELRRRGRLFKDYEGAPLARASDAGVAHVLLAALTHAARALPEGSAARNEVRVACRASGGRVEVDVEYTAPTAPDAREPLELLVCRSVMDALGGSMRIERREDATAIRFAFRDAAQHKETLPPRAA